MNEEYMFNVGSLKFMKFKELYDNIKERTNSTTLTCNIVDSKDVILSFPVTFEKRAGKGVFIFTLNSDQHKKLKGSPELSELMNELPKFKVVGSALSSSSASAFPSQKIYGHKEVK